MMNKDLFFGSRITTMNVLENRILISLQKHEQPSHSLNYLPKNKTL